MGFFDFLENVGKGLNKFVTSEATQKTFESMAERAIKEAEQAERDYDAGRISFERYLNIVNKASNTIGNYAKYQDTLNRMKNKK